MAQDRKSMLVEGNIWKVILTLSFPIIVSQLINVLYNMVDRIYIGQGISQAAFTGVGIAFPIIIIVTAFSALFGMGGAPLASIKLGENKKEEANKIMNNSLSSLIYIGIILTLVVTIFTEPILYLFGATSLTINYARDYLFIYALGSVSVMIAVGMNAYITAQGYTRTAMLSVLIGAVLNIILDPIFIYGFKWGVKGAALATVLSQTVSAIWVLWFLFSKKPVLRINLHQVGKINSKTLLAIMALGVSPFVMQATEAAVQIVFNNSIKAYTASIGEATIYQGLMTALLSLMQFIMLPLQGLAQGAQPLISYNFGANNIKRVKDSFKAFLVLGLSYSLLCFLIIEIMPTQLVGIFSQDPEMLSLAPRLGRIFFIGMSIMGVQIACQNTFLSLGQSKVSLLLALLRKVILLIPLAIILPMHIGVDGVFIAEAIADVLAVITTSITFIVLIKKILEKRQNSVI